MKYLYKIMILGVGIALCGACNQHNNESTVLESEIAHRPLTVIGHGEITGTSKDFQGNQTLWLSELEICAINGILIINDGVYGTLDNIEAIAVSNGIVHINGTIVESRPMTPQEHLAKYPFIEEHFPIAGHSVKITSQHRSGIQRRIFSKVSRIVIDGLQVDISPEELVIDSSKRVQLSGSHAIEISPTQIMVGNNIVWPETKDTQQAVPGYRRQEASKPDP
ncbi:MAG: hypothetical protein GX382_06825 [Syntrophomonadaceae bacterium]|jgi:hypothetical protein|nr:hypothetical protein [Syntrophomonadaceae bacterium]